MSLHTRVCHPPRDFVQSNLVLGLLHERRVASLAPVHLRFVTRTILALHQVDVLLQQRARIPVVRGVDFQRVRRVAGVLHGCGAACGLDDGHVLHCLGLATGLQSHRHELDEV